MAFRRQGEPAPESARGVFFEALKSGLSRSAAATVAGVSQQTGSKWARIAGHVVVTEHFGIRYSSAVRETFWSALRSGASIEQAALSSGVSQASASIWVK